MKPDLAAPGAMIVSSKSYKSFVTPTGDTTQVVVGGSYVAMGGTSQAAPHVAGAVALTLGSGYAAPDSLGRLSTPSQIRARLQATASSDSLTSSVPNNRFGAGKLNVRGLLAPVMGIRFTAPKKGTVFQSHWGQFAIMGDSATFPVFDSVAIHLALDGCTYTQRCTTLVTDTWLPQHSYNVTFYAPEQFRTDAAKLLAVGYRGQNKVHAVSDSLFSFSFGTPTSVGVDATPYRFAMLPNVPNPFNPATSIRFTTATTGRVSVRIYSVDGSLVRSMLDKALPAGPHQLLWDGTTEHAEPAGSGIYFLEVRSGGERLRRKLTLLR